MAQQTKAQRSAVAGKGAATWRDNEAKSSGKDLKRAAGNAADAAKRLGRSAARAASDAGRAADKKVRSRGGTDG
jgi:hypothetical protein